MTKTIKVTVIHIPASRNYWSEDKLGRSHDAHGVTLQIGLDKFYESFRNGKAAKNLANRVAKLLGVSVEEETR